MNVYTILRFKELEEFGYSTDEIIKLLLDEGCYINDVMSLLHEEGYVEGKERNEGKGETFGTEMS